MHGPRLRHVYHLRRFHWTGTRCPCQAGHSDEATARRRSTFYANVHVHKESFCTPPPSSGRLTHQLFQGDAHSATARDQQHRSCTDRAFQLTAPLALDWISGSSNEHSPSSRPLPEPFISFPVHRLTTPAPAITHRQSQVGIVNAVSCGLKRNPRQRRGLAAHPPLQRQYRVSKNIRLHPPAHRSHPRLICVRVTLRQSARQCRATTHAQHTPAGINSNPCLSLACPIATRQEPRKSVLFPPFSPPIQAPSLPSGPLISHPGRFGSKVPRASLLCSPTTLQPALSSLGAPLSRPCKHNTCLTLVIVLPRQPPRRPRRTRPHS